MNAAKPIWLIEDFDEDNSRLSLIEEVRRQGMQCEVICPICYSYLPYLSTKLPSGKRICDLFENDACVIFQGSLNLARQLQREKSWIPGVWCSLHNFKCSVYYPYFAKFLLNSEYFFVPVADLLRRKDELYRRFAVDTCLFVRPDSGFKTFTGRPIPYEEFSSDYEWMVEFSDPDSLALISNPKPIDAEYRFVVAERKVIAGSTYRIDGDLKYIPVDLKSDRDRGAWEFLDSVFEEKEIWTPDPVFVVDVCISNDNYYILELNSFSCSGLYACDLQAVVKSASDLAVKEWLDCRS